MKDLTKACSATSDVLAKVSDDQLGLSTPCEKLSLDEIVAHIGGLAVAFTAAPGKVVGPRADTPAAACKESGPLTDPPPTDGAEIDADWRTSYPRRLSALAAAWQNPDAWQGM